MGVISDKINNGDILCNKSNDNKNIGIAIFTKFLDKRDESLISIETVSNIKNDIYSI